MLMAYDIECVKQVNSETNLHWCC